MKVLKIAFAALMSLIFVFAGGCSQAAEEKDMLCLLPRETDAELEGFVPQETAIAVTAEGEISDFLLPEDERPKAKENMDFSLEGEPAVLIYHTHTLEAYRQTDDCTYDEYGAWRTKDYEKNVVAVGEVLKTELEKRGISVLHDTTNHEPPKLATSYSRSEETMAAYKKKYPSIRLFIDVHRDAANVETQRDDVVMVDGKRCARIMFVVGTGTRKSVTGAKPYYEENLALAEAVRDNLEGIASGLTREVRVKTGRYNQHISDMCILAEVGHNANTLEDAENSAVYLAEAIAETVK